MTHKFKTGDTGLTRDGRPYRVIADDVKGDYPILALVSFDDGERPMRLYLDGSRCGPYRALPGDLMPPSQRRYINVYEDGNGEMLWGKVFLTRGEADKAASDSEPRLSCIRVDLVGGRFDG